MTKLIVKCNSVFRAYFSSTNAGITYEFDAMLLLSLHCLVLPSLMNKIEARIKCRHKNAGEAKPGAGWALAGRPPSGSSGRAYR